MLLSIFGTEPIKETSLEKAVNKLELTTNEQFKKKMTDNKHKSHFLLPQHLYTFIDSFPPFRFSFSNSMDFQDGKVILTWFFSEYALEGNQQGRNEEIAQFLKNDEFTKEEADGDFSMKYTKEEGFFSTRFIMLDLVNYEGGDREMCGGTLVYSIELSSKIKPVKINEALEVLPSLQFEFFPKKLYAIIADLPFTNITYGGTWQRYYTWSVSIPYSNPLKQKVDLKMFKDELEDEGFEIVEEQENKITYRSTDHIGGSWFYITVEENNLELRFQPNS